MKFLAFSLLFFSTVVYPSHSCVEDGLLPKNKLSISINSPDSNGMTEETFIKILRKIDQIFQPIFIEQGGILEIDHKWESNVVNAMAQQMGGNWVVRIFGGLARHKDTTEDGLALITCHEIGHHLAGSPRISSYLWASNEGQSDYYAVQKCLKKYFQNEDNISFIKDLEIPLELKDKCEEAFANEEEVAICIRSGFAGLSMAKLFFDVYPQGDAPDLNSKDDSEYGGIYHGHPIPQCRLDTFVASGTCDKSSDIYASSSDPSVGYCTYKEQYTTGLRPKCWYGPNTF